MPTEIRSYVRSLGIDAYVVGGAVRDELLGIPHRDEDFLVPGVDQAGLRSAPRAPRPRRGHGGSRAARRRAALPSRPRRARARARGHRADAAARRTVDRAGPPRLRDRQRRVDRARGGHGPSGLHDQRDGDPARRTATLIDPFGGVDDLASARAAHRRPDELRGRSAPARPRAPVRVAARLRPRAGDRWPRCRPLRRASPTSRPSESAAGSRPTGRASSRSSCSGAKPARALRPRPRHRRAHPDHPGVRPRRRLLARLGPAAAAARRAHLRRRAERRRRRRPARGPPRVPCCTTSESRDRRRQASHAAAGALLADRILRRLRYPTRVRHHVVRIVAEPRVPARRPDRRAVPRAGSSPRTATSWPST